MISVLRRADESSLFPRFRNRLRPASPNPRWLPGQLVPPAWRNRTGRHSRPVQRKACLFIRGWDAALPCSASHSGQRGEVLFCQWPPLHFDFSAAFEGSGYILPPQLALSTLQRVNFIALRLVMMQRAGVTREVRVSGEHERERE